MLSISLHAFDLFLSKTYYSSLLTSLHHVTSHYHVTHAANTGDSAPVPSAGLNSALNTLDLSNNELSSIEGVVSIAFSLLLLCFLCVFAAIA
jgi:Leucine-rich repeat (LRR) protein